LVRSFASFSFLRRISWRWRRLEVILEVQQADKGLTTHVEDVKKRWNEQGTVWVIVFFTLRFDFYFLILKLDFLWGTKNLYFEENKIFSTGPSINQVLVLICGSNLSQSDYTLANPLRRVLVRSVPLYTSADGVTSFYLNTIALEWPVQGTRYFQGISQNAKA
jgi:hypothetical protein